MKELRVRVLIEKRLSEEKLRHLLHRFNSEITENESIFYYLLARILLGKEVFEPAGGYRTMGKDYLLYRHKKTNQRFIVEKPFLGHQEEEVAKERLRRILEEENLVLE
ncbi:MAG: hypothetical protein COS84_09575 [Armatimonadetes bacterium CG07_land_8_20_14_0_80_40_9]|nr:MAG: hypothetical protein COS84_09575 [Armatimonadetes bacterium CG07_land_8_20_14_0_80_40_9]